MSEAFYNFELKLLNGSRGSFEFDEALLYQKARERYGNAPGDGLDAAASAASPGAIASAVSPGAAVVQARLADELERIIKPYRYDIPLRVFADVFAELRAQGLRARPTGALRGSLTALLMGIGDDSTDPLPPHYRCPACAWTEFVDPALGYDTAYGLPERNCPRCGAALKREGLNLPFAFSEVFSPPLDLIVPDGTHEAVMAVINRVAPQPDTADRNETHSIFGALFSLEPRRFELLAGCGPDVTLRSEVLHSVTANLFRRFVGDGEVFTMDAKDIDTLARLLEANPVTSFTDLYRVCALARGTGWLGTYADRGKLSAASLVSAEDLYAVLEQAGVTSEYNRRRIRRALTKGGFYLIPRVFGLDHAALVYAYADAEGWDKRTLR